METKCDPLSASLTRGTDLSEDDAALRVPVVHQPEIWDGAKRSCSYFTKSVAVAVARVTCGWIRLNEVHRAEGLRAEAGRRAGETCRAVRSRQTQALLQFV